MAKPEWGVKRYCGGCGARFYDMRRDPIVCPKCGVVHDPVGLVKSSRPKATAASTKPAAKPIPVDLDDTADTDDDDDLLIDDSDDLDDPDDDAEDDEALEDASELGEDKDDMFEVMDNVEVDKEQEG